MVINGYRIIKEETYLRLKLGTEFRVALGHRSVGPYGDEYVTWKCKTLEGGEEPSYYWGYYFQNRYAAIADFHTRLAESYLDILKDHPELID